MLSLTSQWVECKYTKTDKSCIDIKVKICLKLVVSVMDTQINAMNL